MTQATPQALNFTVDPTQEGKRLDHILVILVAMDHNLQDHGLSRNRLSSLIQQGHLSIDGTPCLNPSKKLKKGAMLCLTLPAPVTATPMPQAMQLDIIYEDDALLVVNKQAGLVVHPGAGNPDNTLVNGLLHHCGDDLQGIGGTQRPGIVHRIDKDTSGLLVVAKTMRAHHGLSALFHDHHIERSYIALCWGKPAPAQGRIDKALARDPYDRLKMRPSASSTAKQAITDYDCLYHSPHANISVVKCNLQTGRTHQIRVHMTDLGHPLVGDKTYYSNRKISAKQYAAKAQMPLSLNRQALHASVLGFIHPITATALRFEAKLPADMQDLVDQIQQA